MEIGEHHHLGASPSCPLESHYERFASVPANILKYCQLSID